MRIHILLAAAFLGLASLGAWSPELITFAMYLIVGIPLAIALAVAPTLALYLAVSLALRLFARLILRRDIGIAVPVAFAVALGAIPPIIANRQIDDRFAKALERNHDDLTGVPKPKSPALQVPGYDAIGCGELCLRFLLFEDVNRVLVLDPSTENVTVETAVRVYALESREDCPEIRIDGDKLKGFTGQGDMARELRVAMTGGRCLIESTARLGDADALLAVSRQNAPDLIRAGFELMADTQTEVAMVYAEISAAGVIELVRSAKVATDRYPILLLPLIAPAGIQGQQGGPIFYRKHVTSDTSFALRSGHINDEFFKFLTGRLGFNLERAADDKVDLRATLAALLDRPGELSAAEAEIGNDYVKALYEEFAGKPIHEFSLTAKDRALVLRLVADVRFPSDYDLYIFVRNTKDAPPEFLPALSDAAFSHLRTLAAEMSAVEPSKMLSEGGRKNMAYGLVRVIVALPPEVIRSHRDDITWAISQKIPGFKVDGLIKTLSVFGAEGAAETFEILLSERRSGKTDSFDAALVTLCQIGPDAKALLPEIVAAYRDGQLPVGRPYYRLVTETLIQIGADPETIWPLVESGIPIGESRELQKLLGTQREKFDRLVSQSRKQPGCKK